MKVIESISEMQKYSESLRRKGEIISFVPTMGYFHDGHLNLMKEGKQRSDCVVTSIYVNPTQFGPGEDFEKYPRDLERDAGLARGVGVDVIFTPSNTDMYPENYQSYLNVEETTKNLCGLTRPGHFRGVTTICLKLFNIVKPHVTIFGKKDYQQFVTIKRMVQDINLDLEVVGLDTTREADGLAMSSRNVYLKGPERESALCLSRSLVMAKDLYDKGVRDAEAIIETVIKNVDSYPYTAVDYVKICETKNLRDIKNIDAEAVIALAVKVGKTRLIDNYVFGEKLNL
ncbi:MAG: pantoate--beta-alanine ligase [Deltaproteobacteria bacterium]|nr:pantoate--beta-alanine ligase [Deltaproteobacteria bacterium]